MEISPSAAKVLPGSAWSKLPADVRAGLLLMFATALALLLANSPAASFYDKLLAVPMQVRVASLDINKPILLWINDGLMALFFLHVGLEIKREVVYGHLSDIRQMVLPGVAALGGMVIPALIYAALNWHDANHLQGWAIPSATDIAFAIGVLALLGTRVPPALKAFVLALAVMDDLGAVVIIAVFFTSQLSVVSLSMAALFTAILFVMNRLGVRRIAPYLLVGVALWVSVLKSGVHATLAGVVVAMAMPMLRLPSAHVGEPDTSPAEQLEHMLHPWVIFVIVPIFAFANAGVGILGLSTAVFADPVFQGVALGLFVGKQLGIFAFSWLCIRAGWAALPKDTGWLQLYGASILCGIGFTMSLFISSLAFGTVGPEGLVDRLGVLSGSFLSALFGYGVLRFARPGPAAAGVISAK